MENSDGDSDSDMSDDMLEQDGSIGGLSSIAALFQQKEKSQEVVNKWVYKPCTPFRPPPATRSESDGSGNETEIEGEPKEEFPTNDEATTTSGAPLRRAKSASYTKETAEKSISSAPEATIMRRSLSTPDRAPRLMLSSRSSKRNHREVSPERDLVMSKRSRQTKPRIPVSRMEHEVSRAAVDEVGDEPQHQKVMSNLDRKPVEDDAEASEIQVELTVADEVPSSHSTPRHKSSSPPSLSRQSATTSSRSATGSESTGSQAESGSVRVILTGLELTASIRKKIKSIAGAVYESNVERATHVIAPQNQLKRTVKLLCGISCCTHILGERWLNESARVGAAVDEQANCLRDEEAESKWQFDLRSTMYGVPMEQRQRLFAGLSVFITNHKSVLPPVKDMVKIVECAGGKASSKGKPGPNDVVITSEAALTVATVRKQLASANPERIYSPELILSGILQQRVELTQHRLELPSIGKTWATKRRK
ncbi:unnamed protein product [Phytophthora fragariaefolia]|uniref:Unnamed protein product n=1 Tax=Phytophthora fragariaefolia TaxID=1490495 RepID=A0A9W6U2E2_9STRA|nr:unnamed protein product [Phytophthora fragariaefolia]